MQNREIEQMRAEDKFYGEKQKRRQVQQKDKSKGSFKNFSARELMDMEDTYDFE